MDFLSSHYLLVKFELRLMHYTHALNHVLKTYTERSFLANKYIYRKLMMFFFAVFFSFFRLVHWDNGYV